MKNLTQRVLVALWGIPLILFLSYKGSLFFLGLILIINGMSLWEFYTIYHRKEIYAHRVMGVLLSSLFLILLHFHPQVDALAFLILIIVIFLMLHLQRQSGSPGLNTALSITGVLYITLFLATLLFLRNQFAFLLGANNLSDTISGWYVVFIWISIWICDTAAYFGGTWLGRHKLAPEISPNKTVEGAVLGFLAAILTFYGLGQIFLDQIPEVILLGSGICVGLFGQLGDLVESRFKRDAGVKDTSTILPGHGGFLDRFDSLIFVSPFLLAIFLIF